MRRYRLPALVRQDGNDARIEGGPVALEAALRRATAKATHDVPLRPNRVHPLWRTDHDNNVGINAPEIEFAFEPDGDWIDLTTVHKGGLFGTDYRMLFPADGIEGIKRFYLDTLVAFGKRGLSCQPAIIGIGLGGSKDTCMVLGKRAACLRTVGDRNPDPGIAELEDGVQGTRQLDRHGRHGLRRQIHGDRLPHRGRLLPHRRHADERARLLPVIAPRLRPHSRRRHGRIPHRSRSGSPPISAGRQLNGQQRSLQESPPEDRARRRGPARSSTSATSSILTAPSTPRAKASTSASVEEGVPLPIDLPAASGANFHCSPAATINDDGTFSMGAVTATASFRFSKWIGQWLDKSGAKLILGKGGMSSKDYREHFVPHGAIYLTTVGYGTGALLGRGVKKRQERPLARRTRPGAGHVGHRGRELRTVHRRKRP